MSRFLAFGILLGSLIGRAQAPSNATVKNQAWELLTGGVQDKDAEHRKQALTALGTITKDPKALDIAKEGLRDKDTLVRQTAAAALGDIGSPDAVPYLRAVLDDGPEVSFTAAKSLWNLGDRETADEILWQVIAGERKDTPGFLQSALRKAKHKLSPAELAFAGAKEAAGMFGPASIGVEAVHEALSASKQSSAAPGRTVAAEILAKDESPNSLMLLEWALDDSNWTVRVAVAKALGERGNAETISKLLPHLDDDHHAVRYMAAAAIIKLAGKQQSPGQ